MTHKILGLAGVLGGVLGFAVLAEQPLPPIVPGADQRPPPPAVRWRYTRSWQVLDTRLAVSEVQDVLTDSCYLLFDLDGRLWTAEPQPCPE